MMESAFESVREDYQNGDLADEQLDLLFVLMDASTDGGLDKEKFDEVMKGEQA